MPDVPRDSGPAEPAAPAAPSAAAAGLPPADDLGWGPAAWEDAGGFLSILGGGGLGDGGDPGEGETPPPVVNLFIDTLDIDIFNVIQNTLIQNTSVIFDAANGGSILVGGDVSALGSQTALAGDGGLGPF
ncbi:hypothetical protein [Chthonobacter rhizosphaerae]|uniref:hypothetical protein n=1 Tax=Chthonobacter rhizosphaerae TaxID=2735553 RepID=UPI0015EFDB2C|nr:hypothetical protein [Chthonobacter rhizosphaerae]